MELPLAAAIDRLYATFARVPRPVSLDYCACCFTPEQEAAVLAPVPLRELPVPVVRDYAVDALLTVGGPADFRYFLPRVLEIAVTEGFDWPDLEALAARLRKVGWAADERDAVRVLLRALWTETLARHPSEPDIDTVLCAIGNAEDDLAPYLSEWTVALAAGGEPATLQLRELLTWHALANGDGGWRLTNAFWDHRDGPVGDWLTADTTLAAVRAGFDAAASEPAGEALVEIASLLGAG